MDKSSIKASSLFPHSESSHSVSCEVRLFGPSIVERKLTTNCSVNKKIEVHFYLIKKFNSYNARSLVAEVEYFFVMKFTIDYLEIKCILVRSPLRITTHEIKK